MVDPVQEALNRAQQRLAEMPPNDNVGEVFSLPDITELPKQIDLAILATTADVRLLSLERLLAQCDVRNIVLEKVLFQRENEYDRAGRLLESHGARAWVNCPRRLFTIYKEIRDYFRNDTLQCLQVYGGDWGLGCNGVHFADLFSFLTGGLVEEYDTSLLDSGTYPSKRAAFVEFGGTLIGRAGKTQLWLTAVNGSKSRHLIMLRAEKRSCLIDEQAGQSWFMDEKEGWHNVSFNIPYQSKLTGDVAMGILLLGSCDLPDYRTSTAVHLPFIRSLQKHIAKTNSRALSCPIT